VDQGSISIPASECGFAHKGGPTRPPAVHCTSCTPDNNSISSNTSNKHSQTLQIRWEANVKNGVCGVGFDRRDIEMNKFVVTCLEAQFHVFDARTQHPTKVGPAGMPAFLYADSVAICQLDSDLSATATTLPLIHQAVAVILCMELQERGSGGVCA
jgi:hypothetical protein